MRSLAVQNTMMSEAERASYRRFLAACEQRLSCERKHLERLRTRLERATRRETYEPPGDVAAMHTQVQVRDLVTGRTQVETVVLPPEDEVRTARRALHSWTGPLLLGAREGDEIEWCYGRTRRRWRIEKILSQATPRAHPSSAAGARIGGPPRSRRPATAQGPGRSNSAGDFHGLTAHRRH